MTVYYDPTEDNIVANRADEYATMEDGNLVIDCSEIPYGTDKMDDFITAFAEAIGAGE